VQTRWESNSTSAARLWCSWAFASGINPANFVATWKYDTTTGIGTIKLYAKCSGWDSYNAVKLSEHSWGSPTTYWEMYNSLGAVASIPEDETQVVSTFREIKNPINTSGTVRASAVYGAVYNDFAEYREADTIEPGRVVCEYGDDTLKVATERLQPGANVVSDTFGFAIGETETAKTPIAVAGRVLVYTFEDRNTYQPGDAVCAAPNGTVSKMSREEIINYPERIVGTVSAVPTYETWGEKDVSVNGRIWIKVR
jgi:hypothetical protein